MGNMTIISPGPLTTVQDCGRFGYRNTGFSCSGAADLTSAAIANILVGNGLESAVIEMTLMGMTVRFDADCVIALAGADMKPQLNDSVIENYKAYAVKAEDILKLGFAAAGCRGYLAVSGGFDVPVVMGSRSTALKYGVGGFNGRKLSAGDVIEINPEHIAADTEKRRVKPESLKLPSKIYAVYGPQDDMFTENAKRNFENCEYTVTPDSDRMGVRLQGEKLETVNGSDIISDGIVPGSVQVPKSGMPIVLMCDCQTTGGYAKIATVCSFSLPVIAQLKPGEKFSFNMISVYEAQKLKIKYHKILYKFAKTMGIRI